MHACVIFSRQNEAHACLTLLRAVQDHACQFSPWMRALAGVRFCCISTGSPALQAPAACPEGMVVCQEPLPHS